MVGRMYERGNAMAMADRFPRGRGASFRPVAGREPAPEIQR